ncbi:hypothetical protein CS022_14705 [Veronia nyctiphanis]|uniref:Bacterial Ig domain-containing protein n=2 Tax=Veronia nyctiphanis TaxID=1278244 RepID=A0A4Q0YTR3_9GAMM|nr:hypothetical protein CS022_14705 [Veronia nyctiphanis]
MGGSGYSGNDIGGTVTVSRDGEELGTATIQDDGSWQIDNPGYQAGDGITISIEDVAGNTSMNDYNIG